MRFDTQSHIRYEVYDEDAKHYKPFTGGPYDYESKRLLLGSFFDLKHRIFNLQQNKVAQEQLQQQQQQQEK